MGNTGSATEPFAEVELMALETPLVVIDKKYVRSQITRLRMSESAKVSSKSLVFTNAETGAKEFRTGRDKELGTFLDGATKTPLVKVSTKPNINGIYYVHRPENAPAEGADELLQIYVKQGAATETTYLDTTLRVDFTDASTNERCKIEMEGEWRARTGVLWLERSHSGIRTAVAKVYRPPGTRRGGGFVVAIAPNVDIALVQLICAVVDDDLKRHRLSVNKTCDPIACVTQPRMDILNGASNTPSCF